MVARGAVLSRLRVAGAGITSRHRALAARVAVVGHVALHTVAIAVTVAAATFGAGRALILVLEGHTHARVLIAAAVLLALAWGRARLIRAKVTAAVEGALPVRAILTAIGVLGPRPGAAFGRAFGAERLGAVVFIRVRAGGSATAGSTRSGPALAIPRTAVVAHGAFRSRLRVAHARSTDRHRTLTTRETVVGALALRRTADSARATKTAGSSHARASSGAPVAATAVGVRPTPHQRHHPQREDA